MPIMGLFFCLWLLSTQIIALSTASTIGSEALWLNPSGLAFLHEQEAMLGYDYDHHQKASLHHGDVRLAVNWAKIISLSAGLHTETAFTNIAKAQRGSAFFYILGTAIKFSDQAALGFSAKKAHHFLGEKTSPLLFTLGTQIRPLSFLAIGGHYEEMHEGVFAAPLLQGGLSFRPYKNYITISFDAKFKPQSASWDDGFLLHPIISTKLSLSGYEASLGLEIPKDNTGFLTPIYFLSLSFNFSHLGLNLNSMINAPKDHYHVGSYIRASSAKWPSIAIAHNQAVKLSVEDDGIISKKPASFTEAIFANELDYLSVIDLLKKIAQDKSIALVLLKINGFSFGNAKAEEWRQILLSLRDQGKKVLVYLDDPSAKDYYIASAANKIVMNSEALINIKNIRASLIYYADLFAYLGIKAESVVAGSYKTAPRSFTHSRPEKEEIEVTSNILDSFYQQMLLEISKARNLNIDKLSNLFDQGEITAKDALASGLIDETILSSEANTLLNNIDGKSVYIDYEKISFKEESWSSPKKIAVIPIIDSIVDGYQRPSFLPKFGVNAYAMDIIDMINDASLDNDVLGMIVRIDSPGGDVLASSRIANALLMAKKTKPVFISMGDVCASGGYLIASAGDRIFAQKNTITGSIGVFSLYFSGQELIQKLGIFVKEITPIKNPGSSLFRPLSPKERELSQGVVNWYYDNFITTVSNNLGLTYHEIKSHADGHVWLGQEALAKKLIHDIGGFLDAKEALLTKINLTEKEVILDIATPGSDKKFNLFRLASRYNDSHEISPLLNMMKPYMHLLSIYHSSSKVQARLPFALTWSH